MRLVCCLTYQPDHRRPDAHGAAGISRTGGRSLAGPAGRASDHEAGCDVSRQREWLRQWRGGGVGAGVQQGVARFAPCAWNPADLGALVSELGLGRRPWIPSRSCESRPRWPILPFLCVCCRRWRAPNETPIESAAGEAASLGPLERLTIWPTACGEPLISFEMLSPDSDPPSPDDRTSCSGQQLRGGLRGGGSLPSERRTPSRNMLLRVAVAWARTGVWFDGHSGAGAEAWALS